MVRGFCCLQASPSMGSCESFLRIICGSRAGPEAEGGRRRSAVRASFPRLFRVMQGRMPWGMTLAWRFVGLMSVKAQGGM